MINTIKMKSCASYDEEGITLMGCNKVNYIYGHNGSGKSTISNFLQGFSPEQFAACSVDWEIGTEAEIVVYNKNFRMKNLQSMPGVFTLGEATAEQIRHLEELKMRRETRWKAFLALKNNIQTKEIDERSQQQAFENDAWNQILKTNESVFQEAFSGLRAKKVLFAQRVLEMHSKHLTTVFTRGELIEKAKVLFNKKPERFSILLIPDTSALKDIEADEIWNKVIIGNTDVDMAALINELHNSDWVKAGMKYIGNRGICPFCQKKQLIKMLQNN